MAGALLLDLRFRFARPRVIRRHLGTSLKRSLLIHVQLLLPQRLVELQLLDCLALASVGRRIECVALILLQLELQLVLLLLALKLKPLDGARTRIICAPRWTGQDQEQCHRR